MKSLWIAALLALGLGTATAGYASSNGAHVSVRVNTPEFGFRIGSGGHHHGHALPRVYVPMPIYSPRHHHYRHRGHHYAYGHRHGHRHMYGHRERFERHHEGRRTRDHHPQRGFEHRRNHNDGPRHR